VARPAHLTTPPKLDDRHPVAVVLRLTITHHILHSRGRMPL
jgi:hypothetical protein